MTTAGGEDSEMHTDVKEISPSKIDRGTTSADVGTLDRAQPSTGVETELLVERQEPLKAGNKGFEDVKEHTTSKEVLGILGVQVIIGLLVRMEEKTAAYVARDTERNQKLHDRRNEVTSNLKTKDCHAGDWRTKNQNGTR